MANGTTDKLLMLAASQTEEGNAGLALLENGRPG
jgi:hypothetical protein